MDNDILGITLIPVKNTKIKELMDSNPEMLTSMEDAAQFAAILSLDAINGYIVSSKKKKGQSK